MSESIEQTAKRLVRGDRQTDYGAPVVDFTRTGRVWAALLGLDNPISPEMVSILMAALKLSRLAETPRHKDSRIDTIGYMLTLDWVIEDLEAQEAPDLDAWDDTDPNQGEVTYEDIAGKPRDDSGNIEDGFGNFWEPCRTGCDLHVVRPGVVQCNCDQDAGTYGPGELPGDEREAA